MKNKNLNKFYAKTMYMFDFYFNKSFLHSRASSNKINALLTKKREKVTSLI